VTPNKKRRLEHRRQVVVTRRAKMARKNSAKTARRKLFHGWRQARYALEMEKRRHPLRRRGLSSWVKTMLGLDSLKPAK